MAKQAAGAARKKDPSSVSGSSIDDLISRGQDRDPLGDFFREKLGLSRHGNKYVAVLLLIAFGFFVKFRLDQAYERSVTEASDLLWRVQETYASLREEEVTNRAELERNMQNFTAALQSQRSRFPLFADVYQALHAFRDGELEQASTILAETPHWQSVSMKQKEDRILAELIGMARAKMMLESLEENTREQGRAALVQLAREGEFVAAPAVLTLARLAISPEQRDEVTSLAVQVRARAPETGELLGNL